MRIFLKKIHSLLCFSELGWNISWETCDIGELLRPNNPNYFWATGQIFIAIGTSNQVHSFILPIKLMINYETRSWIRCSL